MDLNLGPEVQKSINAIIMPWQLGLMQELPAQSCPCPPGRWRPWCRSHARRPGQQMQPEVSACSRQSPKQAQDTLLHILNAEPLHLPKFQSRSFSKAPCNQFDLGQGRPIRQGVQLGLHPIPRQSTKSTLGGTRFSSSSSTPWAQGRRCIPIAASSGSEANPAPQQGA